MTEKRKNEQNNQLLVFGGIIGVVVAIVVGVIIFQQSASGATINYDELTTTQTEDGAYVLGDPDAPITMVVFEDFMCPHCQTYQDTVKQFIEQHVVTGEAKFEFRMLVAIDPNLSTLAFELVQCAAILDDNPSTFWTAHDTMFDITSSQRFSEQGARDFAERMGISYGALLECVEDDADQWENDARLANQQDWVTGTPAVGWRNASGALLKQPLSGRPSIQELSALVATQQ